MVESVKKFNNIDNALYRAFIPTNHIVEGIGNDSPEKLMAFIEALVQGLSHATGRVIASKLETSTRGTPEIRELVCGVRS